MTHDEQQFEQLITGVIDRKYGICDDFIDGDLLRMLRQNLRTYHSRGEMHPAGIGRHFDFKKNLDIRGDVIRWMEEKVSDLYELHFFEKINQLVRYLNRTCYTQINEFEFHYAYYEAGSFYKRHLDQFKSHRCRKFSLVIYLNEDWQVCDGGNLRLYPEENEIVDVFPEGGRAVFFRSDEVEHEVMASSHRPRMSIAGWLKSV